MGGNQSANDTELDRVMPTQVILTAEAPPTSVRSDRPPAYSPTHSTLHLTKHKFPISLVSLNCENWRIHLILNLDEKCDVLFSYSGTHQVQLTGFGPGREISVFSGRVQIHAVLVVIKAKGSDTALNLNIRVSETEARLESQQATLAGQFFEVQNLYGISTEQRCIICMGNEVSVAFEPCKHACLCGNCADTVNPQDLRKCPVCRSAATGLIKLSF